MANKHSDDQARREYWKESYDNAYEFMLELYRAPLEECGEEMVCLEAAAREARAEVTFSALPHAEGRPRMYYLRRGLIEAFLGAAGALNARGWVMHVEDAFRTVDMQGGLWRRESTFRSILERVRWELGGAAPDEAFMFRRVSSLLAACPRIGGHLSGAAIDVSVFRRAAGEGSAPGAELDRGGPYLEVSEKTPMDSPFVSAAAQRNRRAITEVFERFGFAPYPYEFWHYSRGDVQEAVIRRTGGPARYGPVSFDASNGKVTPVPNAGEPFVSLEEVRRMIAEALAGRP